MLQNTLRITFSFYCQIENKSLHLPDITVSHNEARIFVCVCVVVFSYRTDFRPTWNLKQSEPIAGNYYPINSRAFIKVCVYVCVCVREKCFY